MPIRVKVHGKKREHGQSSYNRLTLDTICLAFDIICHLAPLILRVLHRGDERHFVSRHLGLSGGRDPDAAEPDQKKKKSHDNLQRPKPWCDYPTAVVSDGLTQCRMGRPAACHPPGGSSGPFPVLTPPHHLDQRRGQGVDEPGLRAALRGRSRVI
jgi:hypothetical protein